MKLMPFPLIAAACVAPAALAQTMEPGEWQFDSVLTGPELPKPQTASIKQCLSKEDVADPTRFTAGEHTKGCTAQPGARTPDSYQWTVSCPEQGVTGQGTLRYTRRAIEAEIRTEVALQDRKVALVSRVSGRLLGPCKTE